MAAKKKTTKELLREWREDAGLNLDRAALLAEGELESPVSREMVRRYEVDNNLTEQDLEPGLLAALLTVYGKSASDLPKEVAERVKRHRDLLVRSSGCIPLAA